MTYHEYFPVLFALFLLATNFLGAGLTVHRLQVSRKRNAVAFNGRPADLPTKNQPQDRGAGERLSSVMTGHRALSGPPSMVDISEGGRANTRHIEEKLLVIPHGIYVVGMVQSANKLRVEGEILTPLVTASQLVVTPGGAFKGVIEVEEADIGGTMDGTILVSGRLIVRSTGTILGAARYSILHVEDGARIVGKLERISQDSANLPSRLASAAAVMPPPMACVDAVESRLV